MENKPLFINELKEVFLSLKINESIGHDDISYNVVSKCFGELCTPIKHIFDLSFKNGIFPDSLKIVKVTHIYKSDDISRLRLYSYLQENKILYSKQFCFQAGHSIDHTIIQLVEQIYENFEYNKYTLGVFIDLGKAFDTVDHNKV